MIPLLVGHGYCHNTSFAGNCRLKLLLLNSNEITQAPRLSVTLIEVKGYSRQLEIVRDMESQEGSAVANRLVHGDNLHALGSLSIANESVDLVYTDPPYNTGRSFSTHAGEDAYNDSWPSDEDFYEFLRPRFDLLHALLAEHGSMYVHIDVRIAAYLRVLLLDPTFGKRCFRNEITRVRSNPKNFNRRAYGNTSDRILFYTKAPGGRAPDPALWNDYRIPMTKEQEKRQFPRVDTNKRRFTTTPLHAAGVSKGETGKPWRGVLPPKGKHWRRAPHVLEQWDEEGKLYWSKDGNPREIIYADEHKGNKIQDIWSFKDKGLYRDLYPTEKNLQMLEQIVLQSSPEGGLVIDPFAGSGATCVAAARHGRRFIGMDKGEVSLGVSLRRLSLETNASFELLSRDGVDLVVEGDGDIERRSLDLESDEISISLIDQPELADEDEESAKHVNARPLMVFGAKEVEEDSVLRAVPLDPTDDEKFWRGTQELLDMCDRLLIVDRDGRLTSHPMPPRV